MATGDQNNIVSRLASVLPPSWFQSPSTNETGLLNGFANVAAYIYSLVSFAKNQTRIATASGFFLDLIALDYFGNYFRRKIGENDAVYSQAIRNEILIPRQTRGAIQSVVGNLTKSPVTIFEPWNANDSGGFNMRFAFCEPTSAFGSNAYPYTIFVTAVEPPGAGIPSLSGFGNTWSGFNSGAFYFADLSTVTGGVTNQNIYDAINQTRAAGITAWVNVSAPSYSGGRLNSTFTLDSSLLAYPGPIGSPYLSSLGPILLEILSGVSIDLGLASTSVTISDDLGLVSDHFTTSHTDLGTIYT